MEGVTFLPHPLSTAIPWMIATKTRPKSILRIIDKARRKEMLQQTLLGLSAKVDKLELAGAKHEWTQHMQLRVPKEIWSQNNCVTMFQMWVAYRDATLQLNLFHPGRATNVKCPVSAACGDAIETIPHIMWDCNRARATWKRVFERWTGQQADDEDRGLLLPCIASRVPPATMKSIRARINNRFGFFTSDHVTALHTIWFILSTTVPSVLWRKRNETVHEHTDISVEEYGDHAWRTCAKQIQAVAKKEYDARVAIRRAQLESVPVSARPS